MSAGGTERLHQYWVHGEGAAKIAWGSPGDFDRCVHHLGKYIADPRGYCDLAHKAATGMWPAQHAEMTGRSAVTTAQRAEMTSASIDDLPDSDFAYIEPGGKKDASGRTVPRSLRHFPVHDAAHARNALSRAPQSPFGSKAMPKIRAAAKKFGVDVSDDSSASRQVRPYQPEYIRPVVPLDDIRILSRADGSTSGRTVEAFATVFDKPVPIKDFEGKYTEVIDRSAFNKTLSDLRRSRSGLASVKVLFNHGKDAEGNPAPEFTKPVGVPVMIEPDARGLLTRTEYNNTQHAEEVLELIRSGAVTAQSFTGRIIRSDPQSRPGYQHRPLRDGTLPLVRRTELGLREYGPVLWAAYDDAEILGVRMAGSGDWEPDENDEALLPDGEAAADEPSPLEGKALERHHQHALYRLRSKELRESKGLVW